MSEDKHSVEERVRAVEVLVEANLDEHKNLKNSIEKILSEIQQLNITVRAEMARRSVLVWLGSMVLAGVGYLIWAVFGPDAVASIRGAVHVPNKL